MDLKDKDQEILSENKKTDYQQWQQIHIKQYKSASTGQYFITTKIDADTVSTKENTAAKSFSNVKIWLGDNWSWDNDNAIDITIHDLRFIRQPICKFN